MLKKDINAFLQAQVDRRIVETRFKILALNHSMSLKRQCFITLDLFKVASRTNKKLKNIADSFS